TSSVVVPLTGSVPTLVTVTVTEPSLLPGWKFGEPAGDPVCERESARSAPKSVYEEASLKVSFVGFVSSPLVTTTCALLVKGPPTPVTVTENTMVSVALLAGIAPPVFVQVATVVPEHVNRFPGVLLTKPLNARPRVERLS